MGPVQQGESRSGSSMFARLDIQSRTVLRNFLIRLSLSAWVLLLFAGIHRWPYRQAVGIFHLMCAVSALCAMAVALLRREKPQAATLNLWDESLAFSALSLLALFVWRQAG